MIFIVDFLELVIGGFQCAISGHMLDFQKTRPDAQTGVEKEDVSGKTRTYGNPTPAPFLPGLRGKGEEG